MEYLPSIRMPSTSCQIPSNPTEAHQPQEALLPSPQPRIMSSVFESAVPLFVRFLYSMGNREPLKVLEQVSNTFRAAL